MCAFNICDASVLFYLYNLRVFLMAAVHINMFLFFCMKLGIVVLFIMNVTFEYVH